jgi:hypothetical protein
MADICYICHSGLSEGILRRPCTNSACTVRAHSNCLQKYYASLNEAQKKQPFKCVCTSEIIKTPKFSSDRLKINMYKFSVFIQFLLIFIVGTRSIITLMLGISPFTYNFEWPVGRDKVSEDVGIPNEAAYTIMFIMIISFCCNFIATTLEDNGKKGCCCFSSNVIIKYGELKAILLYVIGNIFLILLCQFTGYIVLSACGVAIKPDYNIYYNPLNPVIGILSLVVLFIGGFNGFGLCHICLKEIMPTFYENEFGEEIPFEVINT